MATNNEFAKQCLNCGNVFAGDTHEEAEELYRGHECSFSEQQKGVSITDMRVKGDRARDTGDKINEAYIATESATNRCSMCGENACAEEGSIAEVTYSVAIGEPFIEDVDVKQVCGRCDRKRKVKEAL